MELERADSALESYNVCLIDQKLPDMDGVALARSIRKKYKKDALTIVIAAYAYRQTTETANESSVDLFVSKPLFQSSLMDLFITLTGGEVTKAPIPSERADISGKRILLVEDNPMNRIVAKALIEKLGILCDTADDGKLALDAFLVSPPGYYDAILMDIQMPNMDGYEATQAIRSSSHPDAKTIPIIACSANAFHEDVAKSISMGMNAHVAKPILAEKLAAAFESAFLKHSEAPVLDSSESGEQTIDCEAGVKRFLGDRLLYEEMLSSFLMDESFPRSDEAFERNDYAALFEQSHALKGVAGNLDMPKLYRAASEMAEYLRHCDAPDQNEVSTLFAKMRSAYQQVIEEIKAMSI